MDNKYEILISPQSKPAPHFPNWQRADSQIFDVYEASKELKIGILCVPDCAWFVGCYGIPSKTGIFI